MKRSEKLREMFDSYRGKSSYEPAEVYRLYETAYYYLVLEETLRIEAEKRYQGGIRILILLAAMIITVQIATKLIEAWQL